MDAADLPVRKLRLWRSLWFRRLAWWIARRCGIVWSWLTTDWGGVALWLAAVIVLMWLHARLIGSPIRFTDFLTPELALKVLVLTALLWLFHWAYQARRRLVIQTFANFTGDDKLKQYIEGLAPRLLNEIASLNTLYEIIDEARPQTSSEGGIQATVSVLDVGETLKESVTADSKVSLWGLQIPIGAVLGTVGRLAQGPRLAASLHRVGDKPCLIANISGGGSRGGSWQVRFEDLFDRHATAEANATDVTDRTGTPRTEGSGRHNDRPSAKSDSQHLDGASTQSEAMFDDPAKFTETVERMIEQLAYRVFTDFVRVGSRRWRAVCSYSAGLRAYRETQRTMRAKALNLRKAERAFIQALAEDTTFAQCHYNLGIVYKDLGKEQSAAMSFRRAVEEDPKHVEAYHALAWNYCSQQSYKDAIRLCDQAITLQPLEARAWNLKSFAQRKLEEQKLGRPLEPGKNAEIWEPISETRAIATALAWRALCRSALKGRYDDKLKQIACTCTRNLAVAHAMLRNPQSQATFQQAIDLSPTDADLYFELGKTLFDVKNWQGAIDNFTRALAIEEQPLFWAYLANAHAGRFAETGQDDRKQAARDACRRAIDNVSSATPNTLEELSKETKEAWEKIGEVGEAQRTASISTFSQELEKKANENQAAYVQRLQNTLNSYQDWDWGDAQLRIQLGVALLDTNPAEAQTCLEDAITKLQEKYPSIIRERGLHGSLARAYLRENEREKREKALFHAARAVELNPERAWERGVLGEVYFALNDYERAEDEWRTSLDLDPTDHDTIRSIASAYLRRGSTLRDREKRRQAFSRVIDLLSHALEIIESDSIDDETKAKNHIQACGWAHYFLGQFHRSLMQYDEAVMHLRAAQEMGYKPLETLVALGWTYMEAQSYDDAEEVFSRVGVEVRRLYRGKQSFAGPADGYGEDQPINNLLVEAYLFYAFACAERGVKLTQLFRRIPRIEWRITLIKNPSRQEQYRAALLGCRGLAHLKNEDVVQAIIALEQSVALRANDDDASGRSYYHLAQAYVVRARMPLANRNRWIERARSALDLCSKTDLRGQFVEPCKGLTKALDGVNTQAVQEAEDTKTGSRVEPKE